MSALFNDWKKKVSVITVVGTSQFLLLTILAMIFYPGGYSFWEYHFSDLGREVAISGTKNGFSRVLWTTTVLITSICLIFFFLMMITLFRENTFERVLSYIGSFLGVISMPLLAGVGLYPTDTYGSEHDFSQMYFFLFFSLSIMTYSVAIILKKNYFFGYGVFGFVLASIAITYAMTDLFDPISTVTQKLIIYSYISWALVQIKPIWKVISLKKK